MRRIFTVALFALATPLAAADVPKDASSRVLAATVKVTRPGDGGHGSGALVGSEGPHTYALTAAHVVGDEKSVGLQLSTGKSAKAEVLARSAAADLAVIRFGTVPGTPDRVRLAAPKANPSAVVSSGWEKGDAPTTWDERLKGRVRLRRPGSDVAVACWEVERKPAPGRSGGPLIDETGCVVGVAAGHDGATGYYVHADEVHTFLRQSGLKWLTEDEK